MADPQKPAVATRDQARHGEVESLATQVLSALALRSDPTGQSLDAGLLAGFCADILRGGPSIQTGSVADLLRQGVNVGAIIDGYIPAVARELGERWCRDELSFADVTIGTARLQAIVRELSAPRAADAISGGDAPNVMLIVPLDEYHTLGGQTAASQMRRLGLSVCLCLGQSDEEILQKVASRQFDLIAISVSCRQAFDAARRLVTGVRRHAPAGVPILIGGRVIDCGEDVCALTGADVACSDPEEALRLCGIRTVEPSNPATGGHGEAAGRAG